MENGQNKDKNYMINKEEAFALLYNDKEATKYRNNVFDEFGNYVFSTDFVTSVPNTVIGTSNVLDYTTF